MLDIAYIAWTFVAVGASWVTLTRQMDERLGGVIATAIWTMLAFASYNVEVASGDEFSSGTLALLCFGGALLMGVFTFAAVAGQLPSLEQTRFSSRLD